MKAQVEEELHEEVGNLSITDQSRVEINYANGHNI